MISESTGHRPKWFAQLEEDADRLRHGLPLLNTGAKEPRKRSEKLAAKAKAREAKKRAEKLAWIPEDLQNRCDTPRKRALIQAERLFATPILTVQPASLPTDWPKCTCGKPLAVRLDNRQPMSRCVACNDAHNAEQRRRYDEMKKCAAQAPRGP